MSFHAAAVSLGSGVESLDTDAVAECVANMHQVNENSLSISAIY